MLYSRPRTARYVLILVVVLGSAGVFLNGRMSVENRAKAWATELSGKLPLKTDEITVLKWADAKQAVITLEYALDITPNEDEAAKLLTERLNYAKKSNCRRSGMSEIIDLGGVFRFHYSDKSGGDIGSYTLDKTSCADLPAAMGADSAPEGDATAISTQVSTAPSNEEANVYAENASGNLVPPADDCEKGDKACEFQSQLYAAPGHAWENCVQLGNCEEAVIEANVTAQSKAVDRLSRRSYTQALKFLGPPDFVLRPGDRALNEAPFNDFLVQTTDVAAALWLNGECSPDALIIEAPRGEVGTVLQPGGGICMKSKRSYPEPPAATSCKHKRSGDKFCNLHYLLELPHPR